MKTCAWCGHYCFDGEYYFDSITSLDQDYIDAASTAFGLVFCCESCRQAWLNDFNDKWHQKEALKEEEENRRREYERQEYERREDEQDRCKHTLRCDQCGREVPAVRGYDGWNYPMHLNLAGKKTSTFYSESDYRLEDISPDEFGCYCSNQCYEAAKASGLIARELDLAAKAIAEAAKQTQCQECFNWYYIGTGVILKKGLISNYDYNCCSADCARAACTNNCHICGNTCNPLNRWTYSYYDEDGSKQYTVGYCSQACAKKGLKNDIDWCKRDRDKDKLKRLNSATIECLNVNDYIVPEQPIENTGSTSPAPAAAKPAPAAAPAPTPAPAADVDVDYRSGSSSKISFKDCSYSVSGSSATIKAERVNNDSPWRTGKIYLALWFCKEAYTGGTINGTCMAKTDWLGQLNQGYHFPNVDKNLSITGSVDPGQYSVVVTANEKHESGKNYIVGWVNFDNPVWWKMEEPDYRSGSSSKISFQNCSYSVADGKCSIKAKRVQNDSPWRTGKFYLALWFCKVPYKGGTINGTCMAKTGWKNHLNKGFGFPDVNDSCDVTGSVEPGKYYAVVTAQEKHESGKNYIVGWVNFTKPLWWKMADPTPTVEARSGTPSSLSIGGADFFWGKAEGAERTFTFSFALKDVRNLSEWGTGKLFLDLWFCNGPYKGGGIDGSRVFQSLPVSFDGGGSGIAGEESKARAAFQATLEQDSSPATGRYNILFVLTEQNADGSKKQAAYYNFEHPTDWTGPALAPEGQMSSITLQDCRYEIKAGRLTVTPGMTNGSDWVTRPLTLDFYLCKAAGYSGGDVAGTLMASVPLGTLGPGRSGGGDHTVNVTGKLRRGQYHALAVLNEDDGHGGKAPFAWKEFPQPQQW